MIGEHLGRHSGARMGARWLLLAASLALSGCAGSPTSAIAQVFGLGDAPSVSSTAEPAPTPTDPVLAFVATADPGVAKTVRDSAGRQVDVLAEAPYFAASGRDCRRFRITHTGSAAAIDHGLACRTDTGAWERVNLHLNPDSLDGPSRLLRLDGRAS